VFKKPDVYSTHNKTELFQRSWTQKADINNLAIIFTALVLKMTGRMYTISAVLFRT